MKIAKIPKAESKTVEFKKSFNQDTIESLVAFANADGGSVYVGVRDDGKVLGVQLANESETAWVKDGKPTNACYIAFAEGDVPSTLFQTGRFKGDSAIIDSKAFKRDLFGELDDVMEFVRKHLMSGIVITGKPQHDVKHDYPEEAIREIVLNMLVHRDYLDHGGVSIIKIFDDRMEFTNPGGLSGGLTVADLLADRYATKARNPEIAELFRYAGLTERYGSGIKRIMNACKSHGYVDVEFQNMESWFRVILRKTGDGDFTKPLGKPGAGGMQQKTPQKTPQKILSAIRDNPYVGTQDIADRIGVERSTVARAIAKMKASGILRRVGPDKGGHWEVLSTQSLN